MEFDDILEEKGVICECRETSSVHNFMDRGAEVWQSMHRELDPKHDARMVRPWIVAQVRQLRRFRQDTATDYVRVAWGHMVLDHIVSLEKDRCQRKGSKRPRDGDLDWDRLLEHAWQYYRNGGFHMTRYRGPRKGLLQKASEWLFGQSDRARA